MFSDHNLVFVPYFAADGAVTIDPLLRREESAVQGGHVLFIFLAPINYPTVEHLAKWKIDGKSLVAQKLVRVTVGSIVLIAFQWPRRKNQMASR